MASLKIPKSIQSTYVLGGKTRLSNNQFIAVITVFVLLFSLFGAFDWLRTSFVFTFEPFYYYGNRIGNSTKEAFKFFGEIGHLKEKNDELYQDNILMISENALYKTLEQENIVLKEELNLGDITKKKLEAGVTYFDPSGYLLINMGTQDGVDEGDIVSIGNLYIGRVVQSSFGVSKIRTALSSDSILQVEITRKVSIEDNLEQLSSTFDQIQKNIVHSVIKGSARGIIAEDIKLGADIKSGDYVIVNDEKVGDFLIIGQLEEISDDPTQPELSASVHPIINYEELTYVFIAIK